MQFFVKRVLGVRKRCATHLALLSYHNNCKIIMNKVKSGSNVPGTVTLQVLGCGANGAPSSVYLFTDQNRYLFNCGEGTQRLAHEHKSKLSKLQHIFFTSKCWTKLGGLPGLSLTAQDAGVTKLTLHGPHELNELFQAMNRFVILKRINLEAKNVTENYLFEDDVMKVYTTLISRDNAEVTENESTNSLEKTIIYVCKLKPKPGTLDLKKCVEKGVPPGPLLGLLKHGIDVKLDDGTIVKSSEVSEPSIEKQTIIFVDIPNKQFLYSLKNRFKHYEDVTIVVHFTSANVLTSTIYKQFTSTFGKLTSHIYLNSSNSFSGHFAAHRIQFQLNQVHKEIFPILGEAVDLNVLPDDTKRIKPNLEIDKSDFKIQMIQNPGSMTSFWLRPFKGLDKSLELQYNPMEYIKEIHNIEGFAEAQREMRSMLETHYNTANTLKAYPRFIFLGTGSCIPNKTRNVSAILLQLSETAFLLLDCGEGTLGQIIRFYGKSNWQNVIKNLKAVYISHLHADHHIGLIGILKQRRELVEEPLYLFAPKQIRPWLTYYEENIESITNGYILIPNGDMITDPFRSSGLEKVGIKELSTCLVRHCPHSFGVSIKLDDKLHENDCLKITYSGDTLPCDDLIELGKNSALLIHEATMEDELMEEAATKMHCTLSQALDVATKMNAKNIILTHFSQRYAKLPKMPDMLRANVAIAFDFMQVTIDDIKLFPLFFPLMKKMFAEHYEEMERKTNLRKIKLERKRKFQ